MTRWYQEKKKEHFYKEAKRLGYRARSSFKLKQIQSKFKIISKSDTVLDLGAAPGGWSQVAKEIVGKNGNIIGVDILPIERLKGIKFLQGDLTEESTIDSIKQIIGDKKVDVIISDMSPDISGNYSVDQARSIWLCEHSLKLAVSFLKLNGNFVCKVFEGEDFSTIIVKIKQNFKSVIFISPEASRKSSSEKYIIAKYFKRS